MLLLLVLPGAVMWLLAGGDRRLARETESKITIFGANVTLVVFLALLSIWFYRRQSGSVFRPLIGMWRFCRLDSPTTWAIIVCVLGAAISCAPWLTVTVDPPRQQAVLSALESKTTAEVLIVGCTFLGA